jgi:hypothetical protein
MTIEQLYDTLKARSRPEDIAEMILSLNSSGLSIVEKTLLEKAAAGSLKRNLSGYTSMMQTFATAIGAGKQVATAIEIFKLDNIEAAGYDDYDQIEQFIQAVSPIIQKPVGQNDFKVDRFNKEQRKMRGLDLSKRNYNKKWRLLKRLEKKLLTFAREVRKNEFQQIAKHGLAHHLDLENFSKDIDSACFIAYYTARCNLRSQFTVAGQQRPFDEISEMLLARCTNNSNWWAIAHVYTSGEVLSHLTDEQKGLLLGRWTSILQDIALLLEEIWKSSDINKETMIVKRGNDSTTWNNTAGAWNKGRDNWMNLLYGMGMEYVLDELCFGKVLRLMAADVAAWHQSIGGKLDPNTEVWNKLPLPWEVFAGKAVCTKQLVQQYCTLAGIDAEKTGWIAPRIHGVVDFTPTPELVHGVAVSNPFLATVLKKHKYFSGKEVKRLFPEKN